jgi:NADPH:quinone reductase-like Zn-dependent oxidoreductase
MGAVNAVVDHSDLVSVGLQWAAAINRKSLQAMRMLKYSFKLIDDGLVGQQVFAGEATRLAYMTDEAGVLSELAALTAGGELEVPIAEVIPLDEVQRAYRTLEQRHNRGKIVLRPQRGPRSTRGPSRATSDGDFGVPGCAQRHSSRGDRATTPRRCRR